MTLHEDLTSAVDDVLDTTWTVRDGQVVPKTADVGYSEAVKLPATYLYADMADSSGLVALAPQQTVAKVIRLFLNVSVRIIRFHKGHIRSFDGDRVMGIFIGDDRQTRAAKAALQIKWTCGHLIQPKIESNFKSIREAQWKLRHACGIASGDALIVRGGVRGNSDLVSIGVAPNLAAKFSDVRSHPYSTIIGDASYKCLSSALKVSKGENMWRGTYSLTMGGKAYSYYQSSYWWKP